QPPAGRRSLQLQEVAQPSRFFLAPFPPLPQIPLFFTQKSKGFLSTDYFRIKNEYRTSRYSQFTPCGRSWLIDDVERDAGRASFNAELTRSPVPRFARAYALLNQSLRLQFSFHSANKFATFQSNAVSSALGVTRITLKVSSHMEFVIERFKNIETFQLTANGITLLVGGNNAGKSSVLQAIQFGVSVAQTSALQTGAWAEGRLSTSIGQSDLVYSPIKDVLSLARNRRLRESEAEAIRVTYRVDGEETRVTVRKGRNKNILLELIGEVLGKRLQSIQEPYCALVTGLAGIPSEEEFETNIVVRKAAAKGDSNSVFRNILLQLSAQADKWNTFQQQISRVFPGYMISVHFDPDVDETISCTVEKPDGIIYPVDTCGTGVLQAIQIFSYINLFAPKVLLLDEPDSHLHPNKPKTVGKRTYSSIRGWTKRNYLDA
ncbi:AAA family ATPase, partial [Oscillatoria laete-virens NRMC-F 0139]